MASKPLNDLRIRLKEVDEILAARDAICPPGAGRPAQRKGSAVIAGGTVLLSAIFEGYVEDVYDAAVDKLYANQTAAERTNLKKNTSGKNNNANVHQVNTLFFYLGIPWVMSDASMRWQKFTNPKVQAELGLLANARNRLAHGRSANVKKSKLKSWREFVGRVADRLDLIAANHIEKQTGVKPW